MLAVARPLAAVGIALHWLRRRDKAPIAEDWSTAPVHTIETLAAAYRNGANLGIRPGEPSKTPAGYLHLIDMDIRDAGQAEDAWRTLLELWPDARSAPFVISGSGGESRHLYFVTDKPFRSRKLAMSAGFDLVFDPKKDRDVKKRHWEIEIFGTGKQAVLPPSIHPETGEPYRWGREIDLGLLELGIGPVIPSETVESWGVNADDMALDEDDDLMAAVRAQPMGLSEAEITATIADLPDEWVEDRDCWLQVGQALHHEYQGSGAGFDRWCEWSKTSAKYDAKDQAVVWKSFKGARNPVRMASLIKAAADARLAAAHAGLDDLDDLLGDAETPETGVNLPAVIKSDAGADDLADLLGPTPAPRPAAAPTLTYDPEWRSHLQRNEEGVIKPTLPNVQLIVRNDIRTRGIIGYNEFTQDIVLVRSPKKAKLQKESPKPTRQLDGAIWTVRDPLNGDLWTDSHDNAVRAVIEAPERQGGYGLKTSDRDLHAAIDMIAQENAFHPVRRYLEEQTWDGVPRVERLFIDYLGAEDNAYHRSVAAMTLIGAVTRIFEPGHKFDFAAILEGLQGKKKSTFIQVLGRRWFAELDGDFSDSRQMIEQMQGAWIMEIPELSSFGRADVRAIKAFISRQTDRARLAYARRATEFRRQCIFIGSTNDREYLKDDTGGRRFWPVECRLPPEQEIDTALLARNIDQLWAEAVVMYRAMRAQHGTDALPLYLANKAAGAEAKRLQDSRRSETADDVLAGQIEAWLDAPIGSELGLDMLEGEEPRYRNQVSIIEIWVEMMGRDPAHLEHRNSMFVGKALRLVPGWYNAERKATPRFGRQRVFRREGVIFDD